MKPKMLIMPNVSGWILGEIARQIIGLYGDQYDIYYVSEVFARRRPDVLRQVLNEVDFVHGLSESSVRLVVNASEDPPPVLTWIHHVTSWSPYLTWAIERSRMVIATTAAWRDRIRADAPTGTDIRVVKYGVDPDVFRPTRPSRREFGSPENAFAIGFIAGKPSDADGSRKGLDTLRAVLARAHAEIPNLHVCFVGPGWKNEVSALRRSGISAHHAGFLQSDRLPALYCSLDAYLTTSRVEGGPCTVLEAMACEIPVVATDVGLVPDVVESGVNGFSAGPDDTKALADALCALARDPAGARSIGRAARRSVVDAFAWRHTLAALAEPYREMAAIGQQRDRRSSRSIDRRRLMDSVQAADALVWSAAQVRQREIPIREGLQMLTSMWRPLETRAIISGMCHVLPAVRER